MSKKAEKYNTFGKRLLTVADARQMGDTGTLANAIYSNKRCREIVKIREHKEYTNPFEEVEAIRRNIQNHLTQDKYDEAWKVPSQYVCIQRYLGLFPRLFIWKVRDNVI